MIATVEVAPGMTPSALRKQFRKKLMTGGAVLRLSRELDASALESLFQEFSPDASPENLSSMVLAEIALHPNASEELLGRLSKLELKNITLALSRRGTDRRRAKNPSAESSGS